MNFMQIFACILIFQVMAYGQGAPQALITPDNAARIVEIARYIDVESYFTDVIFHPNGEVITVIANENDDGLFHDGEIRFFDQELQEISILETSFTGISIAYNFDGSLLAIGSGIGENIGRLKIINTLNQEVIFDQNVDAAEIRDIAFSFDSAYVAVALGNSQVLEQEYSFVVISVESGEITSAAPPTQSSNNIAFLNQTQIVVTSQDLLQIWSVDEIDAALVFQTDNALTIGQDMITYADHEIVYQGVDMTLYAASFSEVFRETVELKQPYFFRGLTKNPKSSVLVVGYIQQIIDGNNALRKGLIGFWDLETEQEIVQVEGHTDTIMDLAFSSDGTLLASGGADGTVRLWGIPAGKE